ESPSPPSRTALVPPHRRDHHIVLDKVRRFWVDGVLRPALGHRRGIDLRFQPCHDLVDHPWNVPDTHRKTSNQTGTQDLLATYENADRALLILGEPGGGKTCLMLRLAERLIARAEQDAEAPIPIVLNLTSWAERKGELEAWMVEELVMK